MEKIALSELLVELRRELQEAQKAAAKEDLRFKVEDVELELQVGASAESEGKAGAKFWVYNAEVKGAIAKEATHTVRLKLAPSPSEGNGDLEVSRRDRKEQ